MGFYSHHRHVSPGPRGVVSATSRATAGDSGAGSLEMTSWDLHLTGSPQYEADALSRRDETSNAVQSRVANSLTAPSKPEQTDHSTFTGVVRHARHDAYTVTVRRAFRICRTRFRPSPTLERRQPWTSPRGTCRSRQEIVHHTIVSTSVPGSPPTGHRSHALGDRSADLDRETGQTSSPLANGTVNLYRGTSVSARFPPRTYSRRSTPLFFSVRLVPSRRPLLFRVSRAHLASPPSYENAKAPRPRETSTQRFPPYTDENPRLEFANRSHRPHLFTLVKKEVSALGKWSMLTLDVVYHPFRPRRASAPFREERGPRYPTTGLPSIPTSLCSPLHLSARINRVRRAHGNCRTINQKPAIDR